ncbi:protein translocase subunit SecF [Candidatus Woesearchaeota archaeon]|nr:protein translocase subunit SecF [Candidatus Woesearchaeota archaeon]
MKGVLSKLLNIYDKQYKKLLIIPFLLLFLAIASILFQYFTTGDFIHRGVTLKGGVTVTIPSLTGVASSDIESLLAENFPGKDVSVRILKAEGENKGFVIDAELQTKEEVDSIKELLADEYGLDEEELGIEVMGSTLGASFFKETFKAIIMAFIFMSIVVFMYFRIPRTSIAVILAAFSDIVVTLAIVNLMGMKLSTAGIAAFLMLIGYSVDTNMLLSTRVLKRKEGEIIDRIKGAMKTGLMMTFTTLTAIIVGLIFARSEVLIQIMTIILIGLLVDIINTWIQNAGLLRMYMEKKTKHE